MLWKAHDVIVTRGAARIGAFNKTAISDRRFCTAATVEGYLTRTRMGIAGTAQIPSP